MEKKLKLVICGMMMIGLSVGRIGGTNGSFTSFTDCYNGLGGTDAYLCRKSFPCTTGQTMSADQTVCCNAGTTPYNDMCYTTISNCSAYSGSLTSPTCSTCASGYYLSGNSCLANVANCATSGATCYSCNTGYYLYNNVCSASIPNSGWSIVNNSGKALTLSLSCYSPNSPGKGGYIQGSQSSSVTNNNTVTLSLQSFLQSTNPPFPRNQFNSIDFSKCYFSISTMSNTIGSQATPLCNSGTYTISSSGVISSSNTSGSCK